MCVSSFRCVLALSFSCRLALTVECTRMRNEGEKRKNRKSRHRREATTSTAPSTAANKPSYHCAFLLQQRQHQNLIKNSLDGEKRKKVAWVLAPVESGKLSLSLILHFLSLDIAHNGAKYRRKNRVKKRSERKRSRNDTSDFRLNEWDSSLHFCSEVGCLSTLLVQWKMCFLNFICCDERERSPLCLHLRPDEEREKSEKIN